MVKVELVGSFDYTVSFECKKQQHPLSHEFTLFITSQSSRQALLTVEVTVVSLENDIITPVNVNLIFMNSESHI